MNRKRIVPVALAALILSSVLLSAVGAAAAAGAASSTPSALDAADGVGVEQAGNETNNSTTTDGPSLAERSRVAPVNLDKEYASIAPRPKEPGYNVVGEFAIFSVTERVEAVRVQQPGAEARVLDGGQTIQVNFAEDAAAGDSRSLYTVEIFFTDGSTRELPLYVKGTNKIVASAELSKMKPFLDKVQRDAEENGYKPTKEGITQYYEDTKEQAEIFSNLLGPELAKLFAVAVTAIQSSLFLALLAVAIILTARYIVNSHGHKLRSKQNGGDAAKNKREKFQRFYRVQREAAAEEPLTEIDEIGGSDILWKDRFGVATVKQLADLAALGRPKLDDGENILFTDPDEDDVEPLTDQDGNVERDAEGNPLGPPKMRHTGVDELVAADSLRNTWLEPILRTGYLTESEALVHMKYALKRMSAHYGQREYDDALAKVNTLLQKQNSGPDVNYKNSTQSFGRGSAAGGDD